jgi:hypothetical protein
VTTLELTSFHATKPFLRTYYSVKYTTGKIFNMQMCENKHISIEGHGFSRHLFVIIPERGFLLGKLHMLLKAK